RVRARQPRKSRKALWIGLTALVALAAGLAIYFLTRESKTPVPELHDRNRITQQPEEKPKPFEPVVQPPVKPVDDDWVREVAAMPPVQQIAEVAAKLKDLNPGFAGTIGRYESGELEYRQDGTNIIEVKIPTEIVADISPVKALKHLRFLICQPIERESGR